MQQNQEIIQYCCQIEHHNSKEIQGFCLNEKCSQNRFFCRQCHKEMHKKHEKDCHDIEDFQTKFSNIVNSFSQNVELIEYQIKVFNTVLQQKHKFETLISRQFQSCGLTNLNFYFNQMLLFEELNYIFKDIQCKQYDRVNDIIKKLETNTQQQEINKFNYQQYNSTRNSPDRHNVNLRDSFKQSSETQQFYNRTAFNSPARYPNSITQSLVITSAMNSPRRRDINQVQNSDFFTEHHEDEQQNEAQDEQIVVSAPIQCEHRLKHSSTLQVETEKCGSEMTSDSGQIIEETKEELIFLDKLEKFIKTQLSTQFKTKDNKKQFLTQTYKCIHQTRCVDYIVGFNHQLETYVLGDSKIENFQLDELKADQLLREDLDYSEHKVANICQKLSKNLNCLPIKLKYFLVLTYFILKDDIIIANLVQAKDNTHFNKLVSSLKCQNKEKHQCELKNQLEKLKKFYQDEMKQPEKKKFSFFSFLK